MIIRFHSYMSSCFNKYTWNIISKFAPFMFQLLSYICLIICQVMYFMKSSNKWMWTYLKNVVLLFWCFWCLRPIRSLVLWLPDTYQRQHRLMCPGFPSVSLVVAILCCLMSTYDIHYHLVNTSADGLFVPEGIIRPVVSASALT
jgi:multisubunit Na+/H+ antiporter MnhG subunit